MKKAEFIPVFLGVIKLTLENRLPEDVDESVMRTCAWFEIENLVKHIRFAENGAKEKELDNA